MRAAVHEVPGQASSTERAPVIKTPAAPQPATGLGAAGAIHMQNENGP